MRKTYTISIGIGILLYLTGCSGSRVKVLEEQVVQLQTQNAEMHSEVESMHADLSQAQHEQQSLIQTIQGNEEIISQQEGMINDLRMQNLNLKVDDERAPAKGEIAKLHYKTTGDFGTDYDQALKLFHKRWYDQAAAVFRSLIQQERTHDLSDNCQYWLGECYYAQNQFETAMAEFEKRSNYFF